MKINLVLTNAEGKEERFEGLDFSELDNMTQEVQKKYIEDFTRKCLDTMVKKSKNKE